jgi:rare lipoprotein A
VLPEQYVLYSLLLACFFHVSEGMKACTSAVVVLTLALTLGSTISATEPVPIRRIQTGLASYYGPGFNGDRTASGEIFDQRELVAAHRTLPLGSVVEVTNLENGRRVVLRVIDRGPYGKNHRKGCIIDVSKGAARRLHFIRAGLIRVRVRVLSLPDY